MLLMNDVLSNVIKQLGYPKSLVGISTLKTATSTTVTFLLMAVLLTNTVS